ncbi:MAG: hypothetical protein AAF492_27930, partial [Verrucomicrobiota bacterium]
MKITTVACIILFAGWLSLDWAGAAPPQNSYEHWNLTGDPDFGKITEHIEWCYTALTQRYAAVGKDVEAVHEPTYAFPAYDYRAFITDIEAIHDEYLNHHLADDDGSFARYFEDHPITNWHWVTEDTNSPYDCEDYWEVRNVNYETNFPRWTLGDLLIESRAGMLETQLVCSTYTLSRPGYHPDVDEECVEYMDVSYEDERTNQVIPHWFINLTPLEHWGAITNMDYVKGIERAILNLQ